ncbi:hypothetical protein [Acinetobacter sp. ANC 3832]|uniref:hypothetical protein n=1 Tax=Acinetobacter sp. ANC 3832 TaxID=1977874 RepID=UPI000A345302|nr:hypothetical protein [Acinetobacter sp. ANC 3832]OTG94768.1 hypothetical protein B9T35_05165 [Acinetobacter sp. ANC 3832]
MTFVLLGIVLLYVAIIFLVWQLGKLSKENKDSLLMIQDQETKIAAQEDHLKKTLEIMQDLAKKMHIQQEVLDQTTARLNQVEFQNAELVRILQNQQSSH